MIHEEFPTASLHNVTETEPAEWTDGGHRLSRVPESVRSRVNVSARNRFRHPTGCELRFVPETDETTVRVTLSAGENTVVRTFWGVFQVTEILEIGPEPTTLEFTVPDRIAALEPPAATAGAFDRRVCRLRFERFVPVAVHDVAGDCRPPTAEERPDVRYLAYGTSITEGAKATAQHLSYVSLAARELGIDASNLGVSGSAYCEPTLAEHIADREDWDVATLSLSVNMANRGFTLERFERRVDAFVNTVAKANPDRPVVCITLFPYHADLVRGDDRERASAFRAALRRTAEAAPANVSLLEGPDLLTGTGLTTDVLHPSDAGMASIGTGLASALREILE